MRLSQSPGAVFADVVAWSSAALVLTKSLEDKEYHIIFFAQGTKIGNFISNSHKRN